MHTMQHSKWVDIPASVHSSCTLIAIPAERSFTKYTFYSILPRPMNVPCTCTLIGLPENNFLTNAYNEASKWVLTARQVF